MGISQQIAQIDLFKQSLDANKKWYWDTGVFIGRPFKLSYSDAAILVADAWKEKCNGIPQGCFLLAYYDTDSKKEISKEAILLRVIEPSELPTDKNVISSMVEYYKDNIKTGSTTQSALDEFTRYEFSFSGLRCSVLGCFYKDNDGKIKLGADLESFYSAHNYSVIKPNSDILTFIVNYRESGSPGGDGDIKIGKVRYSSSRRFQDSDSNVPVYVKATDFAGKRTGLFGMTRTGKSNSIKKIIQSNEEMSKGAILVLDKSKESEAEILKPFTDNDMPKYPIGQIIFDINGEYANPNLQDAGTAIFDLYKLKTIRYSVVEKTDFRVLRVNFYSEILDGFELIRAFPAIRDSDVKYIANFRSVVLEKLFDDSDFQAKARYDRCISVYRCMLARAGFKTPAKFKKTFFTANQEVREAVDPTNKVDPSKGLTLDEARNWWEKLWKIYDDKKSPSPVFEKYKQDKGYEWADDDLKSLLAMLTRRSRPGMGSPDISGYLTLREISEQHTDADQKPFEEDILSNLRIGNIIIVDLSMGNENLQKMFSERITKYIFKNSMRRFTDMKPNNFIQFYFEEAHNLFPKKDDKDLSQIYNRLAKEGAKLNLGLTFATQEISSISANILKNTQNWFVSHLNNDDEIRELRKYYDFSDFSEGLIRFSQDTDKGFVRMKSYSNAFVVPVQIDKFEPK
jgi:DNA helicase HerA-like ATPase